MRKTDEENIIILRTIDVERNLRSNYIVIFLDSEEVYSQYKKQETKTLCVFCYL